MVTSVTAVMSNVCNFLNMCVHITALPFLGLWSMVGTTFKPNKISTCVYTLLVVVGYGPTQFFEAEKARGGRASASADAVYVFHDASSTG